MSIHVLRQIYHISWKISKPSQAYDYKNVVITSRNTQKHCLHQKLLLIEEKCEMGKDTSPMWVPSNGVERSAFEIVENSTPVIIQGCTCRHNCQKLRINHTSWAKRLKLTLKERQCCLEISNYGQMDTSIHNQKFLSSWRPLDIMYRSLFTCQRLNFTF